MTKPTVEEVAAASVAVVDQDFQEGEDCLYLLD